VSGAMTTWPAKRTLQGTTYDALGMTDDPAIPAITSLKRCERFCIDGTGGDCGGFAFVPNGMYDRVPGQEVGFFVRSFTQETSPISTSYWNSCMYFNGELDEPRARLTCRTAVRWGFYHGDASWLWVVGCRMCRDGCAHDVMQQS
jgi:hypothetical protein